MSETRWDIPENWAWAVAGDFARIVGGGTPSSKVDGNFSQEGIPWITPADLTGYRDSHISRGRRDLSKTGFAGCGAQMVPAGSVLFSSRAPIGYCVVASNDVSTNQGFKSLVLEGEVVPEYVRYYLISAKDYAESKASGTTFMELSGARVAKLSVPIAPLSEQKRIVAKLDGLTARTARARTDLARIPTLIARYKQRILALAFSGELTTGWRSSTEGAEIQGADMLGVIAQQKEQTRQERSLRNNGRNRSLPAQSPNLQDLPSSWAWTTFNDCSWDLTVGHVGPMKDRYVDEGIPFLRSLNIRENFVDLQKVVYIDETFHGELRKSEIRAGELVVVRTGAPGTAAVVPETLGRANCSDLIIARLVPAMNPHYAAYYMNSQFAKLAVRRMQVGVAQQHFNVGAMSQMPVPVATEQEQAEIVRLIESAFNWLDRMAADHEAASKLLPNLDAAILAKAFRGELVPQDQNVEPASMLLKRIQVERATAPKKTRDRRAVAISEVVEIRLPPVQVNETVGPFKIRETRGGQAMTKSRQDDDVLGQPYLAHLIKTECARTGRELYKASDLPIADFYKQLAWEIEHKHIRDDDEKLEAL